MPEYGLDYVQITRVGDSRDSGGAHTRADSKEMLGRNRRPRATRTMQDRTCGHWAI